MNRRLLLSALTAVGAGGLGVGLGWQRFAPEPALPQAQQEFWASSVSQLNGAELPMSRYSGRALLVNFWATWCPPCIEELPLIERYFQQHRDNTAVLAIAVDNAAAVQQFLQRTPLAFDVGIAGLSGVALSKSLGNAGGGLPFSLMFNASGLITHQKTGKLDEQDLDQWFAVGNA